MNKERTVPVKASQSVLGWKDFTDERLLLTLSKLQQLNTYAIQHRIEPSQLAVPISDFRAWGHSDTELRLLVIEGVVHHLRETSVGKLETREFEQAGIYPISNESCFLLAKKFQDLDFSRNGFTTLEGSNILSTDNPDWDLKLRRLTYRDRLIKHFRCPAQNQEIILSAFQEEGWPERIADPIPPSEQTDSKQRLHDAIRGLNRNQTNSLIKFHGDGTGEGVLWSLEK